MGMHAVERRMCRMGLVKVPKQVVDEVRQRFGSGHGSFGK